MVSPRKRSAVVGRLRSGAKGKGDSPEDWVSGGFFNFAESPVIPRRDVNKRRVSNVGKIMKDKQVQNRRQSLMIKRLETDMVVSSLSPRKTRRQSMAMITSTQRKLVRSSPPLVKSKPMLPPIKPAPAKSQEPSKPAKTLSISLSPLKFYSSPQKQKADAKPISPRRNGEGGKRKIDMEDASKKMEPAAKKSKSDASVKLQSPGSKGRGRPRKTPVSAKSSPATVSAKSSPATVSAKSSPATKKTVNLAASPSVVQKKVSRSAIPLRSAKASSYSGSPGAAKGNTVTKTPETRNENKKASPLKKVKSPKPPKKIKTPSPQKKSKSPLKKRTLTLSAEEKVGPRITRNTNQQDKTPPKSQIKTPSDKKQLSTPKKLASPKAVTPTKRLDTKSPKEKSDDVKPKTEKTVTVSKSKTSSNKKPDTSQKTVTPVKRTVSPPKKKATPASSSKKSTPSKKDKTPITKKKSTAEAPKKFSSPSQKTKTPISKNKSATANQKSTSSQKSKTPVSKNTTQTTPKANATPPSTKQKRLTRSAIKSSKKVSVVGKSPSSVAPSFRKTPGSKKTTFKEDDLGSSPLLSAKSQLVLIRGRSPLRGVQKTYKMKAKPYTPKPDSPPSNILKKNMKNKVSQQMKAVTQVEVHQLMNGEISKPVRLTSSSVTSTSSTSILQSKVDTPISTITPRKPISSSALKIGDPEIRVLATTPVSASNLPPTPKSSRKLSESVVLTRHITSQSTSRTSCQRVLSPAAPRSSTPIEEDKRIVEDNSVLESLNLGTVIKKMDKETNFTDDSINTDTSELETSLSNFKEKIETSLSDFKENKSPNIDKKSKWSCLLM